MKYIKKFQYFRFIYTKCIDEVVFFPKGKGKLLIVTIAFNNSEFVLNQIRLLKKFLHEDFFHCIVDNSSELSKRSDIKRVCVENAISYFGVPINNIYKNNKSHAAAMHWAFFQVISKVNCEKFGFIDHDIFPTKAFSFENRFRFGIYGRVINSYCKDGYSSAYSKDIPYWSLWAGFCFFEKGLIKGLFPWSFNFFSKHFPGGYFLDTGGGLWNILYSKLEYPGELTTYQKKYYGNSEVNEMQNQSFEILDDCWIHFVSLSNWRETKDLDMKKEKLAEFLREFI